MTHEDQENRSCHAMSTLATPWLQPRIATLRVVSLVLGQNLLSAFLTISNVPICKAMACTLHSLRCVSPRRRRAHNAMPLDQARKKKQYKGKGMPLLTFLARQKEPRGFHRSSRKSLLGPPVRTKYGIQMAPLVVERTGKHLRGKHAYRVQ